MSIIRCVREPEFVKIRKAELVDEKVRVYYGFDNYRSDVAFINSIVDVIKMEHPEIQLKDMCVHYVDMHESIRHAHFTTVQVTLKASHIKNNFDNFTIL